jgi:hypothetical protein
MPIYRQVPGGPNCLTLKRRAKCRKAGILQSAGVS